MTTTNATTSSTTWDDLAAAHERARLTDIDRLVPPHQPEVAVLTCADARVSPTRLFDLPPGAMFVVRVAGASATVEAVASLTYAVERLGVTSVVVLGHTHCGAVTAALGTDPDAALAPLVTPIHPSLGACEELDCAVPAHVSATVAALVRDPGPLGEALRNGRAFVHGAVVDLADGSLIRLTNPEPISSRRTP